MTDSEQEDYNRFSILLRSQRKRIRGRTDSDLKGYYYDPNHGGCLRTIVPIAPMKYVIHGVYGDDEALQTGTYWSANITTCEEEGDYIALKVNFSGKKKPKDKFMDATFHKPSKTIRFPDKNKWLPMYMNKTQLKYDNKPAPVRSSLTSQIIKLDL